MRSSSVCGSTAALAPLPRRRTVACSEIFRRRPDKVGVRHLAASRPLVYFPHEVVNSVCKSLFDRFPQPRREFRFTRLWIPDRDVWDTEECAIVALKDFHLELGEWQRSIRPNMKHRGDAVDATHSSGLDFRPLRHITASRRK